jgi:hypothetical protein
MTRISVRSHSHDCGGSDSYITLGTFTPLAAYEIPADGMLVYQVESFVAAAAETWTIRTIIAFRRLYCPFRGDSAMNRRADLSHIPWLYGLNSSDRPELTGTLLQVPFM